MADPSIVNITTFYHSPIFAEAGASPRISPIASFSFGLVNVVEESFDILGLRSLPFAFSEPPHCGFNFSSPFWPGRDFLYSLLSSTLQDKDLFPPRTPRKPSPRAAVKSVRRERSPPVIPRLSTQHHARCRVREVASECRRVLLLCLVEHGCACDELPPDAGESR
jgi:hypothetical protein